MKYNLAAPAYTAAIPLLSNTYSSTKLHLRTLAQALCCVALFGTNVGAAFCQESTEAQFDLQTLKQRGIDPKVAEYFKNAARFREGTQVVSLIVNGAKKGRIDARFDKNGALCFNDLLLEKAGLRRPDAKFTLSEDSDKPETCYDFLTAFPQTAVNLKPGREEINIIVSQDAINRDAYKGTNFSEGGVAALFNYDVMGIRSQSRYGAQTSLNATTQAGFNVGGWIVRSQQTYTQFNGQSRFEHLYAYAQRTFPKYKSVFQAGQININSPIFVGASISGVQILPEDALSDSASSGAVVTGIAHGQSTVEVRQSGGLVYSTMVPEGPFTLSDIRLLNSTSDLEVTVRDSNGAEDRFIVPAASFRTSTVAKAGYQFALGKVRKFGRTDENQPWVASGSGSWNITERIVAISGLMASSNYQAVGLGIDTDIVQNTVFSARSLFSNAKVSMCDSIGPNTGIEKKKGLQASLALNTHLFENFGATVSTVQQTSGYRNLSDVTNALGGNSISSRNKSQYTAAVSWSHPKVGGFNVSYSSSKSFYQYSSDRIVASWGKSFDGFSVNASFEKTIGKVNSRFDQKGAFYLSVSIPLGSRNVRTFVSKREDSLRTGASYSERINDYVNYRLAAERNNGSSKNNLITGNVSLLPRYAQLNVGASHSGDTTSYNAQISGGAVIHKNGVTFSPYPVQDTFGIIKAGNVSGIKVSTPYGPVWTDFVGQAVIPHLNAYQNSSVEVSTKTLPRRLDLRNGVKMVEAGRGSVNHVDFEVIKARRTLMTVNDDQGKPLPKGASVLDKANNFLTTVLDGGVVFLADVNPGQELKIALPDAGTCSMTINPLKESNDEAFYDTTSAVCHAQ